MLRIALPNKGTLAEPAATMMREAGYTQRSDNALIMSESPHSRRTNAFVHVSPTRQRGALNPSLARPVNRPHTNLTARIHRRVACILQKTAGNKRTWAKSWPTGQRHVLVSDASQKR